jgi:dGTPase
MILCFGHPKFLAVDVLLCMMNWEKLLAFGRFGEQAKGTSTDTARSEFEVDYDRIIFSAPFRNLQDKTQVFPLSLIHI